MQRALALDGVEWSAADMTFLITGLTNAIKNRTQQWAGTSGVFTGGAVTNPSGFNIAISGPLIFQANGELGTITSPANVTAAPSTTNYIIAVYQETNDTPATYYGGGGPPNIHANETPTVISRTTTAVLGNGEVLLATVVTNGSTSTSIVDNRVILPSVSAGNIALGSGKTIDGMDPSAHAILAATSAVLGHVLLGADGGATAYSAHRGAWKKDEFIDIGATFAGTKILDDSDFTSPPASSEPFNTTGAAFNTAYVPTRQGDLEAAGYGPRVCRRYTLTFTATGVTSIAIGLSNWDDGIRVKANGTNLHSTGTASNGSGTVVNFNTVIGTNTIQVYLCNGGGNQFHVNLICSVLAQSGVIFTG